MYLTACCFLEAAPQSVLGGDGLVLGDLVYVLAGVHNVVAAVLDVLAALRVAVGVAGGGAGVGPLQRLPVVVVVIQLRHLVHLDRGLGGVFDVDVHDAGVERWRQMGQLLQCIVSL